MPQINFFSLGGQDEKGKNCYILEQENSIFMIDVGVKNPIVAKLGIDTIIPNFDYIKLNQNKFKGVFISSAHDNSVSALPWLVKQIPNIKIYTSKFTAKIIINRLIQYKIPPNNFKIIILDKDITIDNINIKSFELASSMPGTIGFNFQTKQGDVLYLANFVLNKLVDYCGVTNLAQIKSTISNKGILFLAMESGHANYRGYANEKALIRPLIEEKISTFPKNNRIIIVAYDKSISTLLEILQLSIDYNRSVILYGRSFAQALWELKNIYNNIQLPTIHNYKNMYKHNNSIILVTGTGSRLYERLDKIAEGDDVYLRLKKTDLVMVIAPPINGHEKFASRAEDKVAEITTHLIDIPRDNFFEAIVADQDIKKVLEILKPKYFFPIRGLYCYLATANKLAREVGMAGDKVVILQNGKVAIFENKQLIPKRGSIKNATEIIIDGLGIDDIASSVIHEREILASDGLLIVNIILNNKSHKLREEILFTTMGLVAETSKEEYFSLLREKINKILDTAIELDGNNESKKQKWNFRETQNSLKKGCQLVTRKHLSKTPTIIINLFEI